MKTLILDGTAISLQAALTTSAATTNPTFVTNYADNSGSGITEGATDGSLNGSTDVSIVPAPTGSNRRVVKNITIFNGDTAAVTVLIKYDNNATQRTLVKVTLAVGDTWTTEGVFDTNGSLKQTIGTVNLTTGVTGTLPVSNGGTGAATITGVLKGNGTSAFTAATAGTDYVAPSGALGTPSSGTLSSCTVDGTDAVGFRNVPVNSQSAAYTLVLADSGKIILHPSSDANARTFTIPANSSVAYPIGTAITFINMTSQVVTIAITTDTMYLSSAGTTGSRSLAQYGAATAIKITSTNWIISGNGLT